MFGWRLFVLYATEGLVQSLYCHYCAAVGLFIHEFELKSMCKNLNHWKPGKGFIFLLQILFAINIVRCLLPFLAFKLICLLVRIKRKNLYKHDFNGIVHFNSWRNRLNDQKQRKESAERNYKQKHCHLPKNTFCSTISIGVNNTEGAHKTTITTATWMQASESNSHHQKGEEDEQKLQRDQM